jgi:AAA family ATP:ADP antiporter
MKFLLRLFGDVRDDEATDVFLLLLNVFLLLAGYYIIKTAREPLILATGGAEMKSYASAVQAVALIGFVPLYGFFASRVSRLRLIIGLTLSFVAGFELFSLGAALEIPYLGFAFYIFVGVFNLSIIAQFWSYANDLYTRKAGERLFGVIAIGATLGAPVGAGLASALFDLQMQAHHLMHITAGILLVSLGVYWLIERRREGRAPEPETPDKPKEKGSAANGFKLVFQSKYLLLLAFLMILLNIVNTTGEYILGEFVVQAADAAVAADSSVDKGAFIGSFYGEYFFVVNILTVLLQAFVAARLAKHLGIAGVLFALPLVALGAYGLLATGAGFAVVRSAKTAENSTDYSIMNTAKAMLWLPTSREEKYSAKQAIDTFFVRGGDVLSAGIVFVGTTWLGLTAQGFAGVNVFLVVVWLVLGVLLVREYRKLAVPETQAE